MRAVRFEVMADGALTHKGSFAVKVAITAFTVILLLLVFALRHVLLLVFGAILIAVGLRGFATAIERGTPLGQRTSMAAAALIVLSIIVGAAWMLGAQLSAQLGILFDSLPAAWDQVRGRLMESEYGASVVRELENTASNGGSELGTMARRLGAFTMSAAGATMELFLVIVASAFFMVNPRIYKNGALALAPKSQRPKVDQAMQASATALRKWLLGTIVSMTFLAVTLTLGLWALGVPAPLALGVLAGAAQFVPLIGPLLASAPGILIAFTVGPETALWTALLYLAASQIEANLMTPLIQQRAVSLPPALTLFAVIAAGLLLGPLGVLFATPLVVVISVFVVIFYVRGVLGDERAPIPGA